MLTKTTTILTARSFEGRSLAVVDRFISAPRSVTQIVVVGFDEYSRPPRKSADPLDVEASTLYRVQSAALDRLIEQHAVNTQEVLTTFEDAAECVEAIADRIAGHDVIFDVSCMPRLHLCAIAAWLLTIVHKVTVTIVYARPGGHLDDERRFSVGVGGFSSAPRLAGMIRHAPSTAVFGLGFEGNRAYAAFRHIQPRTVIAIIGDPGDDSAPSYDAIARRNNRDLLLRQRTSTRNGSSLDAVAFAAQLTRIVDERAIRGENIYWVPLGTKLQALGGVLMSQERPAVQHVFPLPAHRRVSTYGVGAMLQFDLAALRAAYLREL